MCNRLSWPQLIPNSFATYPSTCRPLQAASATGSQPKLLRRMRVWFWVRFLGSVSVRFASVRSGGLLTVFHLSANLSGET